MVLTRLVTLPINSHHQDIYIHIYRIFASPNLFIPSFATKKNWGRWVRFNYPNAISTPQTLGVFEAAQLRKRSSERYEQKFVSWGAAPFGVWSNSPPEKRNGQTFHTQDDWIFLGKKSKDCFYCWLIPNPVFCTEIWNPDIRKQKVDQTTRLHAK